MNITNPTFCISNNLCKYSNKPHKEQAKRGLDPHEADLNSEENEIYRCQRPVDLLFGCLALKPTTFPRF